MGSGRPKLRSLAHSAGTVEPSTVRSVARRRQRRLAVVLVIAWLGLIAAGCWLLASSQANSRKGMEARLQTRVQYAANFVSIYADDLVASQRAQALNWFAAPVVTQGTLDRDSAALGLQIGVVLDARGRVIRATSGAPKSLSSMLTSRYANLAGVFSTPDASGVAIGNIDGSPTLSFGVAYQTSAGRRVFAGAYTMSQSVLPAILGTVLSNSGWQAYLVDLHGALLTGVSSGGPQPSTLAEADPGLFAADRRAPSGSYESPQGKQYYVTAPVAGTAWRIVLRDPEAQLFTFLNGAGRWLAWLAIAGLAVAGLAIIILISRLQGRREQLTLLNTELARLASIDPLTGLRNRRAIDQYLHDALSAARRHDQALSVLVMDIDHFKAINDTLGHHSGDAVLEHTARVLEKALRTEDAIGRWGGEEFLVVLPSTDEEGALRVTERLRRALAQDQPEEARSHGLTVRITIGVAEWRQDEMDELVRRADSALYLGKAAGRDNVQVSSPVPGSAEATEVV
jgi:diguanylate cyclase (GGDEF)-like protein